MVDIESTIITLLKSSAERIKDYFNFDTIPEIELDVPRESSFGDLATNIAMKIGRQIRHPAKEIAHIMADQMKTEIKNPPYEAVIKNIEVGAPGFINFFLKGESLYYVLDWIKAEGGDFGRNTSGGGVKLNIEFASANPTGPLTIAHGRQAAFGDSLADILEFSGFRAKREYYINDEGRQITLLGSSIRAKYLQLLGEKHEFPADGYRGEYITDIAKEIMRRYKAGKRKAPEKFFADYGYKTILKGIKEDLKEFGVRFDIWSSQKKLSSSGRIKKALSILDKNGLLYASEGAVWLKSTKYGDEKDRVVIKSDKSYTYLGPDIAYHMDKYKRGFKTLIDIWGPDHHGYIPRIKAAISGLGYDKESISTLIVQLVTLYRGRTPVAMSTRAGNFVTLKEVVGEIGRDAARYFFLRRKRDSHLDFDLELAKKHSLDNPVYYIQYAHARISSILEFEKRESKGVKGVKPDPGLLKSKEELGILRMLRQFPLIVLSSAEGFEPYRLLPYLEELAKGFHSFYNKHRVVSEDPALTKARLLLAECIKIVIANGLRLLGVSAPTSM
ncbi:MAG: arginine--tRNA ligase [Candidatus Omnitrophica bacterium]|nr:arginine--tRNA ligase [Candidatus Omnitrophota bacterium]